jgi:5-formyltetrahydrofolate cyclo-ligase
LNLALYKIKVPIIKNSDIYVYPDVILVPLLCFDDKKNRLGYGGGYFDKTIKFYRNNKIPCKFIGLGVEALKTDEVPVD